MQESNGVRARLAARRTRRELGWLLDRPYGDRQRIVVLEDDDWARYAKVEAQSSGRQLAKSGALGGVGGWLLVTVPTVGLAVTGYALYDAFKASKLSAVPVSASHAKRLRWPGGQPQRDVLYVAHPREPLTYLPAAHFHRHVFESKFGELVRLLAGLGATSIDISGERAREATFASRVAVPAGLAATGGGKRSSTQSVEYRGEYPGRHRPALPTGMIWFGAEQAWQSVAEQRLQYGLSRFDLVLSYVDDFGVTADLSAVRFRKKRLSLGGKFERHQRIEWRVTGSFADLPR